ncbi:hypothetical protein MNBD_BACTEROID03-2708 [hydrothermal vent metagenome]|uniref:Outer membrane protein beta-barrel domain-containing protein n=1 Tax=hydrothermal vent metagenome TaxID=652676 RepID=A0A3B0TQ48_9ZZZZ
MKRFSIILLIFLLYSINTKAQIVDESINGIQIGALGIWWNNETGLNKNWAFRTEFGYEAPLFIQVKTITNGSIVSFEESQAPLLYQYPLFLPVGSLGVRWYYNSRKRQGNSKNTFHNSGDFASGAFRYYPRFLAYSPKDVDINADGGLFLTLAWGMRRNINYRWNFEFKTGLGLDIFNFFSDGSNFEYNAKGSDNYLFNFTLRIGYKYGMIK